MHLHSGDTSACAPIYKLKNFFLISNSHHKGHFQKNNRVHMFNHNTGKLVVLNSAFVSKIIKIIL